MNIQHQTAREQRAIPPATIMCDGFAMRFLADGGFVCGSLVGSPLTAYAYPYSENEKHAWAARGCAHDLARIAFEMIKSTWVGVTKNDLADEYNARNWQALGMPLPELVEG